MTVLVTGGAGYIGSHTVRALAEAAESVVVIDNLSTGFSAFLPDGVPLFIGDAADENLVERVIASHSVESIVHLAGSVVVPDSNARSARLLSQQHHDDPQPAPCGGQGRRQPLDLFVDGGGVWQSGSGAGARERSDATTFTVRLLEADE
jgi:NAD(P)-dependent dehydrogenase (short-subunit alcohol dehydrogenase family)